MDRSLCFLIVFTSCALLDTWAFDFDIDIELGYSDVNGVTLASTTRNPFSVVPTPSTSPNYKPLSESDKVLMLEGQNNGRRAVFPEASNMNMVVWDEELDNAAHNLTDRCHYPSEYVELCKDVVHFEGITAVTSFRLSSSISSWFELGDYYNYNTRTCVADSASFCYVYKLLAWAEMTKMGCAQTYCPVLYDGKTTTNRTDVWFFKCNYKNVGLYHTDVDAYLDGDVCTECSTGSGWCNNGLCDESCTSYNDSCSCERDPTCNSQGSVDEESCRCTCNVGVIGDNCEIGPDTTVSPSTARHLTTLPPTGHTSTGQVANTVKLTTYVTQLDRTDTTILATILMDEIKTTSTAEYLTTGNYADDRSHTTANSTNIECYTRTNATDYRGSVSTTSSGATCQRWTSQSPQPHSFTPANYPDAGLGGHNFCRNPDEDDDAWCFTTDGKRWEFCDVGSPQVNCEITPMQTTTEATPPPPSPSTRSPPSTRRPTPLTPSSATIPPVSTTEATPPPPPPPPTTLPPTPSPPAPVENRLLNDPCNVNNGGCSHICRTGRLANRVTCSCRRGFQLQNDNSCVKPSACSAGECEHICTDEMDGYTCSCNASYILYYDETSCVLDVCNFGTYCSMNGLLDESTCTCHCFSGYKGELCNSTCNNDESECWIDYKNRPLMEYDNDECPIYIRTIDCYYEFTCENGGYLEKQSGFESVPGMCRCYCPFPWSGSTCEECNIDCLYGTLDYGNCTCLCYDGFSGSDCSTLCEQTSLFCTRHTEGRCDHPVIRRHCPVMCGICSYDLENPTVICPSPITLPTMTDEKYADVAWTIQGTDNVLVERIDNDSRSTGTFIAGQNTYTEFTESFEIGSSSVEFTATDPVGNQAVCSVSITIIDTQAPDIMDCTMDITVYAISGEVFAINVTWTEPTSTDNSREMPLTVSDYTSGDNIFPNGSNTVQYNVSDSSGNFNDSCSFVITVEGGVE